jgi:hypothetical protein
MDLLGKGNNYLRASVSEKGGTAQKWVIMSPPQHILYKNAERT